jgi:pyruvate dehydrogenase phosphatase
MYHYRLDVTAIPDVAHYMLTPEDSFLILATDGVFERLTSQDAVDAISSLLANPCSFYPPWPLHPDSAEDELDRSMQQSENPNKDYEEVADNDNLATGLIRAAFFAKGTSKAEASRLMTLKAGGARRHRDDMTAIVVRFRKKGLKRSGGDSSVYEAVQPI